MITLQTAGEVSESARAFLAAVSVAPGVLDLRPDCRVRAVVAERLEPGLSDEISDELPTQAETRAVVNAKILGWLVAPRRTVVKICRSGRLGSRCVTMS